MDIKQELKQVITEMMTGDLKRAIIFIGSVNNEQMKASNKIPINILISLSQVISIPKLRDKISNSDIIKLIKSCCSIILNPTESEMSNYYRSLYHIIKYLSAKVIIIFLIKRLVIRQF